FGPVHAAPSFVLEVEQRERLRLPRLTRIQRNRHLAPIFLRELQRVHEQAKITRCDSRVGRALRRNLVTAREVHFPELRLKADADLQRLGRARLLILVRRLCGFLLTVLLVVSLLVTVSSRRFALAALGGGLLRLRAARILLAFGVVLAL